MRRFIAIWILLSAGLNVWQSIQIKKLEEKRPIVIYKADSQGAEIKGRVVHKEKIGDLYTITIQNYGIFVVTQTSYENFKDWRRGEIMKPKKYPYSGKRQKVSSPLFPARPIFNVAPIVEEVKVEFGVEVNVGRSYPEMIIHLDVSGYGNRVHSVYRFPGIFLTVGESIQLKMLFYKRLRDLTTDRFLTFRESDWKFFIRDLVNEFAN